MSWCQELSHGGQSWVQSIDVAKGLVTTRQPAPVQLVSGKLWFIHNGRILSSAQTLFDGWCNHHWQNSLLANYSPDTWKFFGKKKKETIQLFTALSKLWRLVQSNYCLCFSYFGSWELEVPLSSNWAMYLAHHHPPTLPILPFGMLITKQVAK